MKKIKTFKLNVNSFKTKRGAGAYTMYTLNVPADIAEQFDPATRFRVEKSKTGIVFTTKTERL